MVIANLKFSKMVGRGGGGAFWYEIPERGFLENLDKNLLFEECVQECACASQIVSHILRMWRLMRGRKRNAFWSDCTPRGSHKHYFSKIICKKPSSSRSPVSGVNSKADSFSICVALMFWLYE